MGTCNIRIGLTVFFKLYRIKVVRSVDEACNFFDQVLVLARMEHQVQVRRSTCQNRVDLLKDVLYLWTSMQVCDALLNPILRHVFFKKDE